MKLFNLPIAYAHCDIPCGIYDPHAAQIAALTVLRMLELMNETKDTIDFARCVAVKEKSAEQCKEEVRIIWGDFFKGENQMVEANDLAHKIMGLASVAKQGKDINAGQALVSAVNDFAEMFWQKKGIKTKRVAAPYKVGGEMALPEL